MPSTSNVNGAGLNAVHSYEPLPSSQTPTAPAQPAMGASNWHQQAANMGKGNVQSLYDSVPQKKKVTVAAAVQRNPKTELAEALKSAAVMEAFLATNPVEKIKTSYEGYVRNNLVHIAAQYGSLESLQVVLRHVDQMGDGERKHVLNAKNQLGETPLMLAEHQPKSFSELLNVPGVDVNVKGPYGRAVLGRSAVDGNVENMKAILARPDVDVRQKDSDGFTPLHSTVARNHEGTFDLLVSDPRVDLNAEDNNQRTPAHFAASKGHVRLLEKMYATQDGKVEASRKFDMDRPGPNGETSFMYAVINDRKDAVKLFLDKGGINFNAQQTLQRLTPLALAGFGSKWQIFDLMMSHPNIDPNFQEKGVDLLKRTMQELRDPQTEVLLGDLSPLVRRLVDSDRVTGDRTLAKTWLQDKSVLQPGIRNLYGLWM